MFTRLTSTLLAVLMAAHYAPAQAQDKQGGEQGPYRIGETPQGLANLIGTKAEEGDLKRLGYDWVRGSDQGPGRHALWYNPKNGHCVRVRVEGDRYQSITATEPRECTNAQSNRTGGTPPGLASLIGTKADETDLKRLGYDWVQGSDSGPGRHALWYNPKNGQCVRVRVEGDRYQSITETEQRECTNAQSNRGGETPPGLASLIGTKADENDLKRLGYNWVEGSDKGSGRQALWYNANNRQCVRVRVEGDRYQSITATEQRECTNAQTYRVGETPQGLAGLVGTKADESDLKRRGYQWVQGSDSGPGRQALWYNATNRHCVKVGVEGDRYQSITEAKLSECIKR